MKMSLSKIATPLDNINPRGESVAMALTPIGTSPGFMLTTVTYLPELVVLTLFPWPGVSAFTGASQRVHNLLVQYGHS